jgi:hypothetical protein
MSSIPAMTFFQGDTSDVFIAGSVTVEGVLQTDISTFTGTLEIRKAAGSAILVTKSMTADTTRFKAFLTPAESTLLTPGKYVAVVRVAKTGISFRKEAHQNILVLKKAG